MRQYRKLRQAHAQRLERFAQLLVYQFVQTPLVVANGRQILIGKPHLIHIVSF